MSATAAELTELLGARLVGDATTRLDDVVHDSRGVGPGALFCCVVGEHHDGHDHAPAAVAAGAAALLCSRLLELDVPQILVDDVRAAMGPVAARVHGDPSARLRIVGVTGTNGKTTVVSMIESVLRAAGRSARSIGTLTGARTTPEATDLQRLLAELEREGVTDVAMEVSSHALVQHRVDGVRFDVAAFTNLGVDHLDFHGTPEAYFGAKALLFEPGRAASAAVNVDDLHGRLLHDASGGTFSAVSIDDAEDLRIERTGSTMRWRGRTLHVPLPGAHNVSNALVAAAACSLLGVDDESIVAGFATMAPVPGRFETFLAEDGRLVVVDYAHTPDALEQVLRTARAIGDPSRRLTVVFGCGGDRDRGKRPLMGRIATELADRVIITTDNPRSEDPGAIAAEIVAGLPDGSTAEQVPERARAIRVAIAEAEPGDVVVVAGKGHEQGQVFADRTDPFDDAEVARAAIASDGGSGG